MDHVSTNRPSRSLQLGEGHFLVRPIVPHGRPCRHRSALPSPAGPWPYRGAVYTWEPFHGEGTVFGAIGRDDLARVQVDWPDGTDLEPVLSGLDARLDAAQVESRTLGALRDALLPELLSGRLRVPEAREQVEVVV